MKYHINVVVSGLLMAMFLLQPVSTLAFLLEPEVNLTIPESASELVNNEEPAPVELPAVVPEADTPIEILETAIPYVDDSIQEIFPNAINVNTEHSAVSKIIFQEINDDQQKEPIPLEYVEGEILVKFNDEKIKLSTPAGRTAAKKLARSQSLEKEEDFITANTSILNITNSSTVEEKIIELEKDKRVEYAEPNYKRYTTAIAGNDMHKDQLWGLDNAGQTVGEGVAGTYSINNPGIIDSDIDAPEAWQINEGTTSEIIVAVIDIGVDYNHPDLLPNMWDGTDCVNEDGSSLGGCNHGYDYFDDDVTPLPTDSSHGTHVAGTIAAIKDNGIGIIGVAPRAKIMVIRFGLDVASEIKAIDFAIQNGAKVINASYAGSEFSQIEYDAINRFKEAGGIFVAAAGNGGQNNEVVHSYPSDYDLTNIISVAATDQSDTLAGFSNYGATSVDVGAPGTNIYSTVLSEQYEFMNGTSMATPHVAGLVALIEGYNPSLIPVQVKDIVLNSGDSLDGLSTTTVSGKRINAQSALNAARPTKTITAFTLPGQIGSTTIDESVHTIVLSMPSGTDVTGLVPTIVTTGVSVSPASGVSQDFSTSPVTYTITALDGTTQTYEVTVLFVEDTAPPVITLVGSNPLSLIMAEIFTDPGATAFDNFDGDISHLITATGTVDTGTAGTYIITYSITDATGNTATYERTVLVIEPVPPTASRGGGGGGGGGGGSSSEKSTAKYVLSINDNARKVTTTFVLLSISPVANAKQMQISNTANFSGAVWVPFKSKYPWTLVSGSGLKTVYVRYGKNEKVVGKAKDEIQLIEQSIPTSLSVSAPLPAPAPDSVVNASTFEPAETFVQTFVLGATDQSVIDLQKMLIAEGYLKITTPTGYYGPMTKSALEAYRSAQRIDPIVPVASTTEQKALLLKELQKKLIELLAELKALTG